MADKNKFTRPFQNIDVKMFFGKGIDRKIELIDFAIEQGLIQQSGAYYKLPNGETIRGHCCSLRHGAHSFERIKVQFSTNY